MTCKDCIHYDVCVIVEHQTGDDEDYLTEFGCSDFKPKSRYIELPCAVGDTVYEHQTTIWMDECGECKYFQVGGFGDPHECRRTKSSFKHPDCTEIEEVVATQKAIYLWLAYGDFGKTVFLTKEEAEKALAERKHNNG